MGRALVAGTVVGWTFFVWRLAVARAFVRRLAVVIRLIVVGGHFGQVLMYEIVENRKKKNGGNRTIYIRSPRVEGSDDYCQCICMSMLYTAVCIPIPFPILVRLPHQTSILIRQMHFPPELLSTHFHFPYNCGIRSKRSVSVSVTLSSSQYATHKPLLHPVWHQAIHPASTM